jgi:hypothetical protein
MSSGSMQVVALHTSNAVPLARSPSACSMLCYTPKTPPEYTSGDVRGEVAERLNAAVC